MPIVIPRKEVIRKKYEYGYTAINVSHTTRDKLRALSAETGYSMTKIMEMLVDQAVVEDNGPRKRKA